MIEINQSAQAMKEMNGFSKSFNIVDQDKNTVSTICRISWEFSDTMGPDAREDIDRKMWDLIQEISDIL